MQYRLRTLLIVVTLVAVFFAGRASMIPVVRQHEQKSAALEEQTKSLEKQRAWQDANLRIMEDNYRANEQIRKRNPPVEAEPGVFFLGPTDP
jgi:beta-lactam-binding protein with PASTA domain